MEGLEQVVASSGAGDTRFWGVERRPLLRRITITAITTTKTPPPAAAPMIAARGTADDDDDDVDPSETARPELDEGSVDAASTRLPTIKTREVNR